MSHISAVTSQLLGSVDGRGILNLALRDVNPDSSADEFSALTDVPLFLGYMISYFLSGIFIVQVFMYYISFRRTDPTYMKLTVFAVFFVEFLSSAFATMIVIYSIINKGYLSFSIALWGFKVVALLCGIASSMVHAFYCWRIHILGGSWIIIIVIMVLSVVQCVMVALSGFGAFQGGDAILEAGTQTMDDPALLSINVLWLAGSAVCDIIISSTILLLQNRILKHLKTDRLATRVERVMSVAVDTGMITAIAACIELLFFLALRDSLVHFILFYTLPKLYSNCLMATLNARLMVPGRGFRESASINETDDPFFYKFSSSGVEINVQTATSRSSVLNIMQQSGGGAEFSPKRNSIMDLKSHDIERDAKTMDAFQDHLIPVVNFVSDSPPTNVPNTTMKRYTLMDSSIPSAPKPERMLRHLSSPNIPAFPHAKSTPQSNHEHAYSGGDHLSLKLEPLRAPEATLQP
jgi:hypothetical protein